MTRVGSEKSIAADDITHLHEERGALSLGICICWGALSLGICNCWGALSLGICKCNFCWTSFTNAV